MSSESVAQYLCEVGTNQRKLQYCRQLLASNTNFIPECVFNLKNPLNTNTQTKSQFLDNIRSLDLGCNAQEETLIFNYFQVDAKKYITFSQFKEFSIPQNDLVIQKVIAQRRKQEFKLDFSLRFSLQKYFFQLIQNQVKLQLLCKFTFPKKSPEEQHAKFKRTDPVSLSHFMNVHGKYPDEKGLMFIAREMNRDKGDCRRNRLIVEFIGEFSEKYKRREKLPEVLKKDPVDIEVTSRTKNLKQNQRNNVNRSKIDFSSSKRSSNPLLINTLSHGLVSSAVPSSEPSKGQNLLENVSQVEKRIYSLMSEVKVKGRGSSPIKEVAAKQKNKGRQTQSKIVQTIKEDSKRQNISRVTGKTFNAQALDLKSGSAVSRVRKEDREVKHYFTDRLNNRESLDYDAVTERGQTERINESKVNGRQECSERASNSSSQFIFKPKNKISESVCQMSSPQRPKATSRSGFDCQRSKDVEPPQKRIEYLKKLIERNP